MPDTENGLAPRAYSGRALFAWCLYDWANSAFTTLVVTFVYATYFTRAIAPDEITGTALWSRGIAATALRLTNTIGPRMRVRDARQTFVGVWIRRLVEGQPFEVWGGEQWRDFTYVDDAVDAFLLAAARPEAVGEIFNLGGPPRVTLARLAELLVELNEGGSFVVRAFPADRRKIDIGDYYADDRLIRRRLGWRPRVDLRTALGRTLAYYRKELRHYV